MNRRMYLLVTLLAFLLCGSQRSAAQHMAIHTSGTQWLTATMNADLSFPMNSKWSLHLPVSYNPWVIGENSRFQQLTFAPGVRYWPHTVYTRHFVSASMVASRFHVGGIFRKKYRYDGHLFGPSLGIGQSWILSNRVNLEVEAGFGLVYARYDKCGWESDSRRYDEFRGLLLIPTRLNVSAVYIF